MRGRPKRAGGGERTTSVAFGVSVQEAILRLQLHRLHSTGKKPTLRELISEGVNALLELEGLEPLTTADSTSAESSTVIPFTKKLS